MNSSSAHHIDIASNSTKSPQCPKKHYSSFPKSNTNTEAALDEISILTTKTCPIKASPQKGPHYTITLKVMRQPLTAQIRDLPGYSLKSGQKSKV